MGYGCCSRRRPSGCSRHKRRRRLEASSEARDLHDVLSCAPSMPILGLHHVTATVDDAQDDLDFCLGALGLRLVKKTVNFDNHHFYHFYYGDARGTPGTVWTTFPYKGHGVRVGSKGAGQDTVTSFSVPTGSLASSRTRLADLGDGVADLTERFDEPVMRFDDR